MQNQEILSASVLKTVKKTPSISEHLQKLEARLKKQYSKIALDTMQLKNQILAGKVKALIIRLDLQKEKRSLKNQKDWEKAQKVLMRDFKKQQTLAKKQQRLDKKQQKKQANKDLEAVLLENQSNDEQVEQLSLSLQQFIQQPPTIICDLCSENVDKITQCHNCVKQLCNPCLDGVKKSSRNCPFCRHQNVELFGEFQQFVNQVHQQLAEEAGFRLVIEQQPEQPNYELIYGETYTDPVIFEELDLQERFVKLQGIIVNAIWPLITKRQIDVSNLSYFVEIQMSNFYTQPFDGQASQFYKCPKQLNDYIVELKTKISIKYDLYCEKYQMNLNNKTAEQFIYFNFYIMGTLQKYMKSNLQMKKYKKSSYKQTLIHYLHCFDLYSELKLVKRAYDAGHYEWADYLKKALDLFIDEYKPKQYKQ